MTFQLTEFVYDRLREFDAIEEYPYGCPPLAKHYADPDFRIVGLPVVYDEEVHLGDVISGHMIIMTVRLQDMLK